MRLGPVLLVSLATFLSACAPSADLRIPNPDGSMQPGRLVIVPVRAESDSVAVTDWSYETAGFEGAADHDPAFWTALTTAIQAELGWSDVVLHAAVPDTGFVQTRARTQGARDLWLLRTVSMPPPVDYAAYDADHVLFVRRAAVGTEMRGWSGPNMGGRERMLEISADVVWMDATRGVPVVTQDFVGSGSERGGLLSQSFNRDSWLDAVKSIAQLIARRATGYSPGGRRLFRR